MCGKNELSSHLDESKHGEVNFKNKLKCPIISKDNINIQSKNDTNVTIVNVCFVPRLLWNLLIIG